MKSSQKLLIYYSTGEDRIIQRMRRKIVVVVVASSRQKMRIMCRSEWEKETSKSWIKKEKQIINTTSPYNNSTNIAACERVLES